MQWEDRGIAVAMSLGGRARDIAQDIPQVVLGQRNGMAILLARIEAELGSELQDRQRHAGRAFDKYLRPRNLSAAEYITQFERLYGEAVAHGLAMSRTLLSQKLLDKAQISDNQEMWILQQCNADYSQYEVIRRALRRIPALDTRHSGEAGAWYGDDNESPAQSHHSSTYNPFQAGGLQRPAPDPTSYEQTGNEEWVEEAYAIDGEESTDDDFLSAEENDDDGLHTANSDVINEREVRAREENNANDSEEKEESGMMRNRSL